MNIKNTIAAAFTGVVLAITASSANAVVIRLDRHGDIGLYRPRERSPHSGRYLHPGDSVITCRFCLLFCTSINDGVTPSAPGDTTVLSIAGTLPAVSGQPLVDVFWDYPGGNTSFSFSTLGLWIFFVSDSVFDSGTTQNWEFRDPNPAPVPGPVRWPCSALASRDLASHGVSGLFDQLIQLRA
jgi:hypothetical protein